MFESRSSTHPVIGSAPPASVRTQGSEPVRPYPRCVTTFALCHGAWHGAWCWDRLVDELAARGHDAITMDLPVDDAAATFEDCADVVVAAMADASEDAVLVGHSLAGMILPMVAARRGVGLMVFLCAVVPKLGGMAWATSVSWETTTWSGRGSRRRDGFPFVRRSPGYLLRRLFDRGCCLGLRASPPAAEHCAVGSALPAACVARDARGSNRVRRRPRKSMPATRMMHSGSDSASSRSRWAATTRRSCPGPLPSPTS